MVCPRCRKKWPEAQAPSVCPTDGLGLVRPRDLVDIGDDPMVGRTLEGRYTILAKLGAGSMGTVYRAKQHAMGREVAIKILRGDRAIDDSAKARFMREARANSLLASPNTVTVFDFGQSENGEFYLAMELLEGESLGQRLTRAGRLPAPLAVDACRQALRSLGEAHAKGIIHRDLKPDNLFFAQVLTSTTASTTGGDDTEAHDEIVKVLDFGIAKMVNADDPNPMSVVETQAGTVFGTPRYMSPEQAQGKPLDARSDLYSLAVILYQMLTGRVPFEGDNQIQTLMSHLHDTVPPLPSEVPDEVRQIVMRCLEKSREARFDSSDALIAAIDAAITTLGTGTSGVLSGEMTIPPRERDTSVSRKVGASRTSVTTQVATAQSATPAPAVEANHFDVDVSEPPAKSTRSPLLWAVLLGIGAVAVLATGGLVWLLGEDVQTAADPTPVVAPQPLIPAVQDPTAPTAFTVFIDSEPSGAEVFRGEERVGATPTFVRLGPADLAGGGVPFRVALEGYGSYVWTQSPVSADVHVLAPLVALAPPPETPLDRVVPRRDRTPRVRPPVESRLEQRQPEDVVIKTRR